MQTPASPPTSTMDQTSHGSQPGLCLPTSWDTTLELITTLVHFSPLAHERSLTSSCSDSGSGDGQFLMYPVSVDGSQRNNFKFSSASKTSIQGVVAAKGGCFKAASGETCGNLLQEGTEDCDCGTQSICSASPAVDKCCNVYNDADPNDADNCKVKSGFDCSPLNLQSGTCCTEDCGFKPIGAECREETQCTKNVLCAASGVCADADPFPEDTYCDMADTFKDKLCDDSGKCTKSICDLAGLTDVSLAPLSSHSTVYLDLTSLLKLETMPAK